jgi:hypothetical protein
MDSEKILVKYSSYTEAQKKATTKYRIENKEKVNNQRKKYYNDRKDKDPNFLIYKREKAKEYYLKKKTLKNSKIDEPIIEESKSDTVLNVPIDVPVNNEIIKVDNLIEFIENLKTEEPNKIEKTKEPKKVMSKEQCKAMTTIKKMLKDNIITNDIFNNIVENINGSIYFKLDWLDKKGNMKTTEFFKDSITI